MGVTEQLRAEPHNCYRAWSFCVMRRLRGRPRQRPSSESQCGGMMPTLFDCLSGEASCNPHLPIWGRRRPTMIICRPGRWACTNRDLRRWAGIDNRQMLELFRDDL